ncbi:MAG: HEAT repeat domain-containing protein [Planctomycetota bacterium]
MCLLVAAALSACASGRDGRRSMSDEELAATDVPLVQMGDRPVLLVDDRETGAILADLDGQIRLWNSWTLSQDDDAQRKRRRIEEYLRALSVRHLDMLEREATSESPRVRAIACCALGFSGNDRVTGTLIAALDDPVVEVVDNALLGLGLLADPDTPLGPVADALVQAPDEWTRSNAAYALKRTIEKGATPGAVRNELRLALLDQNDAVRAQVAAALVVCGDEDDIPTLRDALYDSAPMVVLASAMAVRRIGSDTDTARGAAARALFDAWQERDDKRSKSVLKTELSRLAGRNWGDDVDEWREWAYRLP